MNDRLAVAPPAALPRLIASLASALLCVVSSASQAGEPHVVAPVPAVGPAPSAVAPPSYIDVMERFQQRVFDVAVPSVVIVQRRDVIGTGFFVTSDGLLLTNRHVVGLATTVDIETYDHKKLKGTVVELAEGELDLALIKVEGGPFEALKMAPLAKLRVGSWVATIGHGYGGGWTFTTGMISNIYPVGEDKPIVQTQIPVNPGNSGGPILDKDGNAVAVVTAKVTAADNVNFSIRLDEAFKSIRKLADSCECLVIRTRPGVQVFVDGLEVGHGPRVLLPLSPGKHEVMVPTGDGLKRVIEFPATKLVDVGTEATPVYGADQAAAHQGLAIWELDFDKPNDIANAPRILSEWVGQMVDVELKDGSTKHGRITGFRPPATIKLTNDAGVEFLSLWDIRLMKRRA